jgi:hypothetical protein
LYLQKYHAFLTYAPALTLFFSAHTILARISRSFSKRFLPMNKTLHKKLTEKHCYDHNNFCGSGLEHDSLRKSEAALLKEAGKDLLQPREQAIANILKMARGL